MDTPIKTKAAEPTPAPKAPIYRFLVEHIDCEVLEIAAASKEEAIEEYQRRCGISWSAHPTCAWLAPGVQPK